MFRIVLLRPEVAGNVGAVARAMNNFGFRDLILVAPKADPDSREAKQRATHGESLLASARRVDTLDEALIGCVATAATSALDDGIVRRGMAGSPAEIVPDLLDLSAVGPVALVFGPEPSGMTTTEVARCDRLIRIPTLDECPALNLSHAVAICLYEVRRQWLARTLPPPGAVRLAADEDRERMFQHLRSALEDIHFLWDEKADLLFQGLRQLLTRARLNDVEVGLLHGLARQLEWVVRHEYHKPED